MYIICPYSGRNGHIVAKHIAYPHYIYHPQMPNLQQYMSRRRKDPFKAATLRARTVSRAYNNKPIAKPSLN